MDVDDITSSVLTVFPGCDPTYIKHLISKYKHDTFDRVTEKLASFHGTYPRYTPNDTQSMNNALLHLHEMFPTTPIHELRSSIVRFPLNTIHEVACSSLESSIQNHDGSVRLESRDKFKSPAYQNEGTDYLVNEFKLWKTIARTVFANSGYDFVATYMRLRYYTKCMESWLPWSLSRGTPSICVSDHLLQKDIEIVEEMKRKEILETDRYMAMELVQSEARENHQMIECECCFQDTIFESLVSCSNADLICVSCIERFINDQLYGQTSARFDIPCLAASTECCNATIPFSTVESVVEEKLFKQYIRFIQKQQLKETDISFVECSSCGYVEYIQPPNVFAKGMVILKNCLQAMRTELGIYRENIRQLRFVESFFVFVLSCFFDDLVLPLLVYLLVSILFGPVLSIPDSVHNRFQHFTTIMTVSSASPLVFKCTACHAQSCQQCHMPFNPFHRCYSDEENLRLATEMAMTNAVARTCTSCHAMLMKEDGCNKLVCKCGKSICFVCGKEISREKYSHFCQHFRADGFGPCQRCSKCDLWQTPSEEDALRTAIRTIRQQYGHKF